MQLVSKQTLLWLMSLVLLVLPLVVLAVKVSNGVVLPLTSFHGSLQGVDGTISEFGLGHGVVDVDGGDRQGLPGEHLVQVVHTSGGLFGEAVDSLELLLARTSVACSLAPISFCLWPLMAASR